MLSKSMLAKRYPKLPRPRHPNSVTLRDGDFSRPYVPMGNTRHLAGMGGSFLLHVGVEITMPIPVRT